MENRKLRKVVISGDPFPRGVQYGEKAKEMIKKSLDAYHRAFLDAAGVSWDKVIDLAKTFVPRIQKYDETIMEEVKGMAKGSCVMPEDILAINLRTEILFGLSQKKAKDGCTRANQQRIANGRT